MGNTFFSNSVKKNCLITNRTMMEVPLAREILWDRWILLACSLIFATTQDMLGVAMATSGAICHGTAALSMPISLAFCRLDVACNMILGVFINSQPCAQPVCGALTLIGIFGGVFFRHHDDSVCIYVLFWQTPMFLGFLQFLRTCVD